MCKILILLAGFPGTGKTYLSKIIDENLGPYSIISPDDLKERYFDIYGYQNLKEKHKLMERAWKKYYEALEYQMYAEKKIISDYPFSKKQQPFLQRLTEKYQYKVVTIRLIADLDILYERQRKRDLDTSRHLSHVVSSYRIGDRLENRNEADGLLTYNEFIERCTTRGYDSFQMGKLVEVDVTDFSRVNYSELVEKLGLYLEESIH
ncbi:Predicted kinase [Terribacillus aidingensis]|uniref:Predicted kinase n=1 Tax=Terribacillus aidingensis TaxID=586416 RepID=A0A285P1U3_9BACI|nr:AAA family ATPase [Terribacillus aidingensis]SNZ15699.1 Predicted kinase [Terribacillus aidingensis]